MPASNNTTQPVRTEPVEGRPVAPKPPVARSPVAHPPVAHPPVAHPPVAHPPVAHPPVAKPPVARPPVTRPFPPARPPATQSSAAIKVYLATAEKSVDFLKFSAVPQPNETAADRFTRHCLHYNAVLCMIATLHRLPAKRSVFTTAVFGQMSASLDMLHLASLFMTFLAWAEAQGDTALVAAAQKLWLRLDGAARLKAELPWVTIYDAKADRLGVMAWAEFAAAVTPCVGKALPAGFAAGLAAKARQVVAAPFSARPVRGPVPHAMVAAAAPMAASGPQVDPTAVTVMAALGCAGSLAAVIGTTMSVPETGPIGAGAAIRVVGGILSSSGACSVLLLRMTADSTSSTTADLPSPVPLSPGEPAIDPSGNTCVEPPDSSTDTSDQPGTGEPVDGPVSSEPVDGPVSSEPVDGPVSSEPVDGPVSSEPVDGPVSSEPVDGPVSSEPVDGPVSSEPVDGPVSSEPVDGPVSSEPVDGPVSSEPVDGPVSSEPVDGPVSSEPVDGPVSSEPSSGPVSSEPVDGPVSSGPVSGGGGGGGPESGGGDEMKEELRRRKRVNPL